MRIRSVSRISSIGDRLADFIAVPPEEAEIEQILIKYLPDDTKAILRYRAAEHHCNFETEARAILIAALASDSAHLST